MEKSWLVGEGHIELEKFKSAFVDRLFHREMREAKLEEFIKHNKGKLSIQEYALKFTL